MRHSSFGTDCIEWLDGAGRAVPRCTQPKSTALTPTVPWIRAARRPRANWDAADRRLLGFRDALLPPPDPRVRKDAALLDLARDGLAHGPVHSSIGQEGGAVGVDRCAWPSDMHHRLAPRPSPVPRQGAASITSGSIDPRRRARRCSPSCTARWPRSSASRGLLQRRGGSMHLRWDEAGAMGRTPSSAAACRSPTASPGRRSGREGGRRVHLLRRRRREHRLRARVAEPGRAVEAAARLLHREQRLRGVDHGREDTAEPRLSSRGRGFGIPLWRVDGMDPLAVYLATARPWSTLRAGQGAGDDRGAGVPLLPPWRPLPGSAFGYRTKDEEERGAPAIRSRAPRARCCSGGSSRGGDRGDARPGRRGDGRDRERLDRGRGGGRPASGRTLWPKPEFRRPGLRGTAAEFEVDARFEELRDASALTDDGSSSTPLPTSWIGGWRRTSASSAWARTSTA